MIDDPAQPPEDTSSADPNATPGLFPVPPMPEQERMVEAVLFAAADPVSVAELTGRLPEGCDPAEALSDGWALRTAPDLGWLMHTERVETRRLSRAATETLAIVAYHQPVTRAEIEEIRGVSLSRGTIDQLMELDWIRFGRRRMTPGRPLTFVVTDTFLGHFGLETTRDLPGVKELRDAGLLDSRGMPGVQHGLDDDEEDGAEGQTELFED